jgi:hypothetical protein
MVAVRYVSSPLPLPSVRPTYSIFICSLFSRQDLNQLNQHDAHYTDLRAQANRAGDAMGKAFDASHQAFASGDGARAKQLSEEGKQHQREMERLNGEASGWIFRSEYISSSYHATILSCKPYHHYLSFLSYLFFPFVVCITEDRG